MIAALNRGLDGLVRPDLPVLGRPRPAFQVCALLGLVTAATLVGGLTWVGGLEPAVSAGMVGVGAVTFLIVAMISKAVAGAVTLVFYRHAIAIVGAILGFVVLVGRAPLPYLDVAAVGLMGFLGWGRVGCLMVGCCHGKPAGVGVRYRPAHAAAGFTPVLVGVRLFPTQALEALVALLLATVGTAALAGGAPIPGTVLTAVAVTYAGARFLIETARGDRARPIHGGFSEAQWLSVAVVGAVLAAGQRDLVPARWWQIGAALGLAFAGFFIVAWRYLGATPRHQLLHPGHIHEIATALAELPARGGAGRPIVVATTSLGVQLSLAQVADPAGPIEHITISHRDGPIPEGDARLLVDLVRDFRPGRPRHQIVAGRLGVVHVLFHP